jgi:hypothetical protein
MLESCRTALSLVASACGKSCSIDTSVFRGTETGCSDILVIGIGPGPKHHGGLTRQLVRPGGATEWESRQSHSVPDLRNAATLMRARFTRRLYYEHVSRVGGRHGSFETARRWCADFNTDLS